MKQPQLYVIAGPSGVGKGTLVRRVMKARGNYLRFSVSMTTRQKRPREVDGREYFFVSRPEFERLIDSGGLLEYSEHFDNYYGTPKQFVIDTLDAGQSVILEIDVVGAAQVKENFPAAVSIFILPPSTEELLRRLQKRGSESAEELRCRNERLAEEMACAATFNYQIINDDLKTATAQLLKIIK